MHLVRLSLTLFSQRYVPKLHSLKWQKDLNPQINDANSQSNGHTQVQHSHLQVGIQNFFSNYIQLLSSRQKRRVKLLTYQTEAADV